MKFFANFTHVHVVVVLFFVLAASAVSGSSYPRRLRHIRHLARRDTHGKEPTSEYLLTPVNGSVYLGCDIPRPDIIWKKDGEVYETYSDTTGRGKKRFNSEYIPASGRHVLQISPVTFGDFGRWSCHDFDPKKSSQLRAKNGHWSLVVLPEVEQLLAFADPPETNEVDVEAVKKTKKPIFLDNNSVITVQENDNVKLYCALLVKKSKVSHGKGSSKDILRWTTKGKGSNVVLSSKRSKQFFVQNNDELLGFLSEVTLYGVDRSASQESVVCQSPLAKPSEDLSVTINVQYPPTFTIWRNPGFGIPVIAGMTVALHCDADVKPQMYGHWMKDETPVHTVNGSMIIDVSKVSDSGWYQCYIDYQGVEYSSVGYFLSVKPAAMAKEDFSEANHIVGSEEMSDEKQSDEIKPSSSSPPALSLPRRNASEHSSTSPYSKSSSSSSSSSSQSSASESFGRILDNVMYTGREGGGGGGSSNCRFLPSLSRMPVISSRNSSSVNVILGSQDPPLILSFDVCSNPKPSRLIWVTPIHTLRPGAVNKDSTIVAHNVSRWEHNATCYVASIEVASVPDADHLGEYILIAKNDFGITDGVVVLQVPGLSELTSGGSTPWACFSTRIVSIVVIVNSFANFCLLFRQL